MTAREELDALARQALAIVDKEIGYYRKPLRRWGYIGWSVSLRVMTLLLLAVAAVAPFLKAVPAPLDSQFGHKTELAMAALAMAGILLAVNQVFMISASWSRHTTAMMKIETLRLLFDMEWREFLRAFDATPTADQVTRGGEMCRTLVLSARQVSEAETAAWSGELGRAVDSLQALIKDQKAASQELAIKRQQAEEAEKKAEEAEKKAAATAKTGFVKVRIEGEISRLGGSPKVKVKGHQRDWTGGQLVLPDLPAGLTVVEVTGTTPDGRPLVLEQAATVLPGQVVDAVITVPK